MPEGSPTPYHADFFSVAYRTARHGFIGGAECASAPAGDLSSCDPEQRVPVIYGYSEDDAGNASWQRQVFEGRGYVAAIVWLDSERALAVGGDGEYPRREPAGEVDYDNDFAGGARAWRYESGRWRELEGLAGIGALTALDVHIDGSGETGWAGGLGQLWRWNGQRFDKGIDRFSDRSEIDRPAAFRYRVRQIRAYAVKSGGQIVKRFSAVTSGCCAPTPAQHVPAFLTYEAGLWKVSTVGGSNLLLLEQSLVAAEDQLALTAPAEPPTREVRRVGVRAVPESMYGLARTARGGFRIPTSPGGPEQPGEPSAVVVDRSATADDLTQDPPGTDGLLSSARLVAIDGADGDWAAGVLRSNGGGLAYGATLVNPAERTSLQGNHGVSVNPFTPNNAFEFDAQQAQTYHRSFRWFAIPTYALNAIDVVGATGDGWLVGDKGAVVRLGESRAETIAGGGVAPPRLGVGQEGRLPDDRPYDAYRWGGPVTAKPGYVPALATRPRVGNSPTWEPGGMPENPLSGAEIPGALLMSRAGDDGWALGHPGGVRRGTTVLSLHRYGGGRWSRCDPLGGPVWEPDEACAAFASMARLPRAGFAAAARVPFEQDEDPSNDDEFEAIALATEGLSTTVYRSYRLREGQWRELTASDPQRLPVAAAGASSFELAFRSPDDGWFIVNEGDTRYRYWHWDGDAWSECAAPVGGEPGAAAPCFDPDNRLPRRGVSFRIRLHHVGDRLYLYGQRRDVSAQSDDPGWPLILYRDGDGPWRADAGGFDPGPGQPGPASDGVVAALGVRQTGEKRYEGWAYGTFPTDDGHATGLLRLDAGGTDWEPWSSSDDASSDYLPPLAGGGTNSEIRRLTDGFRGGIVTMAPGLPPMIVPPGPPVRRPAGIPGHAGLPAQPPWGGPLLYFDESAERWRVTPTPFLDRFVDGGLGQEGAARAVAPDGEGGLWVAAQPYDVGSDAVFYRYGPNTRQPVFEPTPNPLQRELTALASGPDGELWAAAAGGGLGRYDRLTGWSLMRRIPGWDLGRIITAPTPVAALAVGPDGEGLAVGAGGRIAEVSPDRIRLDPAAGRPCGLDGARPPCGTARNLTAVAIASDGSAMAGGDRVALLWRPAGGQFQAVDPPDGIKLASDVTAIAMPIAGRAWFGTDNGEVWAGRLEDGRWAWSSEATDEHERPLAVDGASGPLPVQGLAIGPDGRGLAVGGEGLLLERLGDSPLPWRRRALGVAEDLTAVTTTNGGIADGALVGSARGDIFTYIEGRFHVARSADPYIGAGGPVRSLALAPGIAADELEAWVALGDLRTIDPQVETPELLHHTSHPDNPLLNPEKAPRPLPDSLSQRPGEVALAVFGKSDCSLHDADPSGRCPEFSGTSTEAEIVSRRVIEEILTRSRRPDGPQLVVFTGDATGVGDVLPLKRWNDLVADPLETGGLPVFGAVGWRDLSHLAASAGAGERVRNGLNLNWRRAMRRRAAPWGEGDHPDGELGLSEAESRGTTVKPVDVEDRDGPGPAPAVTTSGARTHYAFDVDRDVEPMLRIAVVDSSQGSFAAGAGLQNPIELRGQQDWLERVSCVRGSGPGCSRDEDRPLVVVSSTPSYSYGPGNVEHTTTDAAAFEGATLQHGASAVLSGRLGFNGLYYTLAPGLHSPCPGGDYRDAPPESEAGLCDETADDVVNQAGGQLSEALRPLGAPEVDPNSLSGVPRGVVPTVIASGAGGKLEPGQSGSWHGYSIVRIDESGDPRKTIVEQRPILDWLTITAQEHVLKPGQRMTLRGVARQPLATDAEPRYLRIDSPAITHRYDLVEADDEKPYLPKRDGDGEYVPIDPTVATVDRQSGVVKAGKGRQERTFAVAILSVGDKATSYPLVFEPAKSFRPKPALVSELRLPPARVAVQQPPPIQILPATPTQTPPNPPPVPPVAPTIDALSLPAPPQLPGVPGAPPASPTTPPPPPPVPPPPAAANDPLPLSLQAPVSAISIVPTVIPPTPPPINPAPPGGSAARKEAKQRQAATAKSEEAANDERDPSQQVRIDAADAPLGPPGAAMTRRDRIAPGQSFSVVAQRDQASAWARGALYAGGLGTLAFVLAAGWVSGRPTPRRQPPTVAAPAWARRSRLRR